MHPTKSSSRPAWDAGHLRQNPHAAADKDERVQRMFTAIAGSYDLNNRLHSFGRDQAWRRHAVRLCRVQSGDEVLDVACGTGDLAEAFAAAGAARVVGLDFTQAMLDIAREKAARLKTVIEYIQGDAMALPFADSQFDIVSIAFGIRNVVEPQKALREFRRVLRPGGRLVVLEFSRPRNAVLRGLNDLYCGHIMPFTATLLARDRSGAYRYLPRSVQTFLDPQQLAEAIRDAGFATVEQHPMTFGVCTATLAQI